MCQYQYSLPTAQASGVVAGLLLGGLLNWYVVGYLGARPDGGVADGLERSLDLLQ